MRILVPARLTALRFGSFFLGYSFHILFCVLAAIAPGFFFREGSITGILTALDLFTQNRALGIIYFVGFGLFLCESLVSIWVIQQVFKYFRGSGKGAEMKREAARRTMMSAL
ncbi:Secretory carrier-associated membrane protein 5 [Hibiscus syriacus]|uniref:Secretory carrier-associated membrane protein n=1 Tax=Hibiscus syriacus TaxID=106335 RepID=A0A6A3AF03_HIBSY|nr:Secretory carrier-associated membrane protein 5 [Hibiscus syriacus]